MADHTLIEWTDATWNPITGCSVVSPGCTNCYAMKLAGTRLKHHESRKGLTRDTKAGPVWSGEVRLNEQWLDQPLRWKTPRKIFVCAHGDLFAENVPDEWIDKVFSVMALANWHTFQVLTKRPARMRAYLTDRSGKLARFMIDEYIAKAPDHPAKGKAINVAWPVRSVGDIDWPSDVEMRHWPLPNVWLGTSAEDQPRADERILHLLATPAAVRFVSAEPLLGPIDLEAAWHGENALDSDCWGDCAWCKNGHPPLHNCHRGLGDWEKGRSGLDWVIVGGESGPDARPMHPDWVRALRDQCAAAGVPFFFKQWGGWAPICFMRDGQTDSLFDPPPVRDPEAVRRCKVAQCVLHDDGERFDLDAYSRPASTSKWHMHQAGSNSMLMFSIGKKLADRLLDGVEHSAMPQPEVRAAQP